MNQHSPELKSQARWAKKLADAYDDGISEGRRQVTEEMTETIITLLSTGRLVLRTPTKIRGQK